MIMAKQQAPKPASKITSNDKRKNGKAFKQHPKAHNVGATGRTVGGYSPAALARRAARREAVTFAGLVSAKKKR